MAVRKLFLPLLLVALWTAGAAQSGEEWFEAARQGDVDEIRRLLGQGAEINAVTRYNSTALHFAADKGHMEAVRLLLNEGADPNITDNFYQTTPLTWALSKGHDEVALLLIEKGAENVSMTLSFGVRGGKKALVEAALASGKLEPTDIRSALDNAEKANKTEIAALLSKAAADLPPEPESFSVPQEKLESYAGRYAAADAGLVVEFRTGEGVLIAQVQGQPPLTMRPVAEDRFEGVEFAGIEVSFFGRGGMVEGLNLKQGPNEMTLRRSDGSAEASEEEASEGADQAPASEAADDEADEEELPAAGPAQPWPSFRGAQASGVADRQGAPLEWSVKDNVNVLWKKPVKGIANSSPVIWEGKVFITTAVSSSGNETFRTGLYGDVGSVDDLSEHTWKVLCLDLQSGEVLWERVAAQGPPKGKRHFKSSQANPSPATDGSHLAVVFPSEGLFLYDLEGNLKWKKDLGLMDSGWFYDRSYQWGFAASPILYRNRVIVQVDVHDQSFVAAYRLSDGQQMWRTNRDEIPTWSTPTISELGERDELITNGTTIRAYDPDTGKEIWSLGPNSEVVVGTPVVGDDYIYVTAGYPPVRPVYAVRPGAQGDLTLPEDASSSQHIAWSYQRGGTYMPSPVYYRGHLYLTANNGRLTCYDGKTGERLYRARVSVGGSFSASPVAADGRLYFTAEDGTVTVAKAGKEYKELAVNDLDKTVMASPAISDGVMVFRAIGEVIAVGVKKDDQSGR